MSQEIQVILVSKQNPKLVLNKTKVKTNAKGQVNVPKILQQFGIPNATWIDEDNEPMEKLAHDIHGWSTLSFEFLEEIKIYTDGVAKTTAVNSAYNKLNTEPEPTKSVPAPSSAAPAATKKASWEEDLEKLAELKQKGILTEAEFQAKKKQLLGL